ncbi:Chaperone protein DnaK [Candidatus Gugararchaeum adminiculabundum]|nr:Chaperone protein DnaK [Candidatus Gugararchaeum adminiculabundum]
MAGKEKIIGIDLGTSNSAASVLEAGRPVIIPSGEGITQYGKAFPSYVAFLPDGSRLVGEPARRQAVSNPEGTFTAFKRKMGTNFKYEAMGKQFSPQELSAILLQKIKADAEAFLGEPVNKAVITVPAYFDDNQRQATKDAGEIAGLEVVRIINEPTAACLSYGLDRAGKEEKILVFDLGGGTLDVTIMEFGGGVFEVKSTSGDTQLGGTDMDNTIVEFLANEFKKQSNGMIDIFTDHTAMQRLREAGERAKIELSTTISSEINLPFLSAGPSGPIHFQYKLTRAKLEELVRPIIERCRHPVEQALKDAKLTPHGISKVILVGGPTRMPMVQKFVEQVVGKHAEHGVDPMECVATGAAIQAGVLAGEVKDILLLDVTPLSLGIETMGRIFTKLIDRNTTIPTKKSQIFSTAADMQTSVEIHVLQGERSMADGNVSLGKFQLIGVPPSPRGVPQIEVTFDIDANGILHVSAKDLGTGKEQKMRITAPNKMDKSDIESKIKDAEKYAEEDKKRREEAELRNDSESLIYATEKTMSDLGDKVHKEQKEKVHAAIKELKEALAGKDSPQLKAKYEHLKKVVQEVGSKIYEGVNKEQEHQHEHDEMGGKGTGGAGGPGSAGANGNSKKSGNGGDTVDANFKVEDDEN